MAAKRKCQADDFADVSVACERLKALNTGKQMDAASKTQMLLHFGQKLYAHQAKNSGVSSDLQTPCSQCKPGCKAASTHACNHCAQALCNECTQRCYCCGNAFCAICSIFDYSEFETRSVCFDCSR